MSSCVEAEGAAAVARMIDSSTVDIVSRRREARTALTSIRTSIPTKCTRRRESMKQPILTEAQTLGAKRPIAKGIRVNYHQMRTKTTRSQKNLHYLKN